MPVTLHYTPRGGTLLSREHRAPVTGRPAPPKPTNCGPQNPQPRRRRPHLGTLSVSGVSPRDLPPRTCLLHGPRDARWVHAGIDLSGAHGQHAVEACWPAARPSPRQRCPLQGCVVRYPSPCTLGLLRSARVRRGWPRRAWVESPCSLGAAGSLLWRWKALGSGEVW